MIINFSTVVYEKEAGIGIVTLNRPRALNGLNDELVTELGQVIEEIAGDSEVRAVIITGGDLAFMAKADMMAAEKFFEDVKTVYDKIENMDKPVIAAIGGVALGGGSELALACDIRIAAEGSSVGQPEISVGIIPGAGGTTRLSRTVGTGWAKHLILSGQSIDAETALKIGYITALVPKEQLMDEARKLARVLAAKSPIAMKAAKRCVNYSMNTDLASGLKFEIKTLTSLFATEDQKEGMNAFLEKRKPVYKGR